VTVPRVSVLLPARDVEATIKPACISVLHQTMRDLELIVVDDGSVDGTRTGLRWLADHYAQIRVLDGGGKGIDHALNVALDAARAPVIARMDGDDISQPFRLERQLALLEARPEVGVVGTLVQMERAGGIGGGFERYARWLNAAVTPEECAREIWVESPLAHPTVMMRTEECRALGGYRDCPWPEDYDLWLRYHLAGYAITKVPEVLFVWTDRDDRASRVDGRYHRDRFIDAKAHYLAKGPLAESKRALVWGAGTVGKRLARALRGEGVEIPAFVDVDVKKIGVKHPGGAPVVSPDELPQLLERHAGAKVLTAVGVHGARTHIRAKLDSLGLTEGADYFCCA
jgi:glycosyltransferase involved in cell wall biosynthesis